METRPQRSLRPYQVGILILMGAAGLTPFFMSQPANGPDNNGPDIAPNLTEIVELKNMGIAMLENLDLADADATFEAIAMRAPDELLGFQNLAITLLLRSAELETSQDAPPGQNLQDKADAGTPRDNPETLVKRTTDAIARLLKGMTDSKSPENFQQPDAFMLASRFRQMIGDDRKAVEDIKSALEIDGDDSALWYELYRVASASDDEELNSQAGDALRNTWQHAPDNLHVMQEWLNWQAKQEDPQIRQTFEAARTMLAPLVEKIRVFGRLDVNELIDRGIAGLDENDWKPVKQNAFFLSNVLKPEVARQNDEKRVNRHLLEFVVHDFSSLYYQQHSVPKPKFTAEIPVTLERQSSVPADLTSAVAIRAIDFDLDSDIELVVLQDARVSVWARDESGDWTETVSVDLPSGQRGMCLFDFDRDAVMVDVPVSDGEEQQQQRAEADLDIVVYGAAGAMFLENHLDEESHKRTLVSVEQNEQFQSVQDVLSGLPVDFDHDGDLDLILSAGQGVSIWLNSEQPTFVAHSQFSELPSAEARIHTLLAVDWNRNVSIDIVCLGEGTAGVLENQLHGQLRWKEFPDDAAAIKSAAAMALIDADSNFSWDLVTAGEKSTRFHPTTNPDAGVVRFLEPQAIAEQPAAGLMTWDFDNDGYLDALTWHASTLTTFRGGPLGHFQPAPELTVELPSDVVACDVADMDDDGDLDLIVACAESVELLSNTGGNANHWINVPIRADEGKQAQMPNQRVNLHGIGSLIELNAGTLWQPQVVTGRTTHFGLGQRELAESVRVLWTNGVPEHVVSPKHAQVIWLQQDLKGSCPYLYAWNGREFVFVTDCLWAAPIGLQLADGVLAPPREWEYLKIDGNLLQEVDGEYRLRMTEELWEIGYIDSVRLLRIDRPADTAIYSNEKVGPPSVSEFKVHTVHNARTPVAARDQRGRDVLAKIAQRDDDYLACFDRRFKQGLTEPHFLEVDLGELDDPQQITLFLTGWIRPTDTSLNIAISQRPDLESTAPPSVHVPNENGEWTEVRPFMGFPGGKTKTIAVDLSGIFLTDDYRVRIASTMELYWDHAFFTVDEQPVEIRTTEMPLQSANLRYRGFSAKVPHPGLGPDGYDYSRLTTEPKWPPMEGRLTAYGDVLNLIRQADNRQALLGAGDELDLRFRSDGPELPSGWTSDFILHNVGWDKDADLNTVFGQTVGPLPFAGMQGYPDPAGPGDRPPFADQRRTQNRARFWRRFFHPDQQSLVSSGNR